MILIKSSSFHILICLIVRLSLRLTIQVVVVCNEIYLKKKIDTRSSYCLYGCRILRARTYGLFKRRDCMHVNHNVVDAANVPDVQQSRVAHSRTRRAVYATAAP